MRRGTVRGRIGTRLASAAAVRCWHEGLDWETGENPYRAPHHPPATEWDDAFGELDEL